MIKKFLFLVMIFAILVQPAQVGLAEPVSSATESALSQVAEAPEVMAGGNVTQFAVDGQTVYWLTPATNCNGKTFVTRTRTTQWEARYVFLYQPPVGQTCPYVPLSNLAAGGGYVYWYDYRGLTRVPAGDFTPDQLPELILPEAPGVVGEWLFLADGFLYGARFDNSSSTHTIWKMDLTNPADRQDLFVVNSADLLKDMRWNGTAFYMLVGTNLRRYLPDGSFTTIYSTVFSYDVTPRFSVFTGGNSQTYEYVFYSRLNNIGNATLLRYNVEDDTLTSLYTTNRPAGSAASIAGIMVQRLVGNLVNVYFAEAMISGGAVTAQSLQRQSVSSLINPPEILYTGLPTAAGNLRIEQVTPGSPFLFFRMPMDNTISQLLRLPLDASSLPRVNIRYTGSQILQSIQNPTKPVPLIKGKSTYLRVYARADGPDVPNVTARLRAYWDGTYQATIPPNNPLVKVLSKDSATKEGVDLNLQFLFTIPPGWLDHPDLTLVPEINPFRFPLEPDYNDNRPVTPLGPFTLQPAPEFRLHLIRYTYTYNGVTYDNNDFDQIKSWLYRAYPISTSARLNAFTTEVINDDSLGFLIQTYKSNGICSFLAFINTDVASDINLCPAVWLNLTLAAKRRSGGLPADAYIYASVPGLPRGTAFPDDAVASGPNLAFKGFAFKDAGFYAAHEIGHLLGRDHPFFGSSFCGHSASDLGYPYELSLIGNSSNPATALDSGVNTPSGGLFMYSYKSRYDVMGYCGGSAQWASDYTYLGIFNYLNQQPRPPLPQGLVSLQAGSDFLTVSGMISSDGNLATLVRVERLSTIVNTPAPVPGPFSLRLVNQAGAILSTTAFTPQTLDETAQAQVFIETIPFAAGARAVQILHNSDGAVLASYPISANPPVVSNVQVQGSSPLSGMATISWQANDADGDALTYSLLYSNNAGSTFSTLHTGLTTNSITVDTSALSGGTGFFRVVAWDSANTGAGDSAQLNVAIKSPIIHILSPAPGEIIQYGQPIKLTGYAEDPQMGNLTDTANLVWENAGNVLGVGESVDVMDLPGGMQTITLTVNSPTGMTASQEVTVKVGDNLGDIPPVLSVQPGDVTLQAAPGSIDIQSMTLNLLQTGGPGTLAWTATVNPAAPWLTVGPALSGDISDSSGIELTLQANPTDLATNQTYTTMLEITATPSDGGPMQQVSIPVSLQIGASQEWAPSPPMLRVFLPSVSR